MVISELQKEITSGGLDGKLARLYGESAVAFQRERYLAALAAFQECYKTGDCDVQLLSVPGRSEVGGNHTDHNHGHVLACSVDLDVIAVARKTEGSIVRIQSEGFPIDVVDITEKEPDEAEFFKSKALIKGICARAAELGYTVGGMDLYTTSRVLKGSGLSSSAAFEGMCGNAISHLYNDGKMDAVTMAKMGQYAERTFFGKPCGLMDQLACAYGGLIAIDFKDEQNPVIDPVAFDFYKTGYNLCIVDTAGDHASLNDDYAAVRSEMESVAAALGHAVLRDCDEAAFYAKVPELRKQLGDRAVLRAIHFFNDDKRVGKETAALRAGDFPAFLEVILESGRSSFECLQNAYAISAPKQQGLPLALALSEKMLAGRGAWRVHGGGFAGTIQAFVPHDLVDAYAAEMTRVFGADACYRLLIRPVGACRVL